MFEFLKLYPNKTSFFIGSAIGLCSFILSTSLCVFDSGCPNGNPFFRFAMLIGSFFVGLYCCWLVKRQLKILVAFVVTLVTTLAVVGSGIRAVFDKLVGGENFMSYSLLYGFITLILVYPITLLNKPTDQN